MSEDDDAAVLATSEPRQKVHHVFIHFYLFIFYTLQIFFTHLPYLAALHSYHVFFYPPRTLQLKVPAHSALVAEYQWQLLPPFSSKSLGIPTSTFHTVYFDRKANVAKNIFCIGVVSAVSEWVVVSLQLRPNAAGWHTSFLGNKNRRKKKKKKPPPPQKKSYRLSVEEDVFGIIESWLCARVRRVRMSWLDPGLPGRLPGWDEDGGLSTVGYLGGQKSVGDQRAGRDG